MKRDARNVVVTIVAAVGAGLGIAGCVWGDALLARSFEKSHWAAGLLADPISTASFACFGAAICMLFERAVGLSRQRREPAIPALGEGDDALLTPDDVKAARQQFAALPAKHRAGLRAGLLEAGLQRARAHWSAEDVSDAVKTEAELVQTQTYADYSMIRFLVWAIPTLGFIGTVVGISLAMGLLAGDATIGREPVPATRQSAPATDDKPDDKPADDAADRDQPPRREAEMADAQRALAMAFNTTFVALVLSLVAMFLLHRIESWEEGLLVDATRSVLRRLPLRMYIRQEPIR